MNVMGYSLFLDAVEARPRVTSISVHLHIENTTDTMIPLPQTDIVGVPIGTPHFVTRHCSVRDSQHRQAPCNTVSPGIYLQALKTGILHIPTVLVVNQWTPNVESISHLDFLLPHNLWTTSCRLMGPQLISTISMVYDF